METRKYGIWLTFCSQLNNQPNNFSDLGTVQVFEKSKAGQGIEVENCEKFGTFAYVMQNVWFHLFQFIFQINTQLQMNYIISNGQMFNGIFMVNIITI